MYIREIRIRNFMPYYGDNTLSFSKCENKNVILISGDNMGGKTSFLNSIRWALFGIALARKTRKIYNIDLLNTYAKRMGDLECSVRIKFEHNGTEYELSRSMHFDKNFNNEPKIKVFLKKDNNILPEQNISKEIDAILSYDVSRFFLFDGELLAEYEDLLDEKSESSDRIKSDIEKILGIPSILNGIDTFNYLQSEATKIISKQAKQNSKLQNLAQQLDTNNARKKTKEESIAYNRETLNEHKEEIDELEDYFEKHNKTVAEASKIEVLKKNISDYNENRESKLNDLRDISSIAWLSALRESTENFIKNNKKNIKSLNAEIEKYNKEYLKKEIIEESLKKKTCGICCSKLDPNNVKTLNLMLEKLSVEVVDLASKNSDIVRLNDENDLFQDVINQNKTDSLRSIENDIVKLDIQIDKAKTDKAKIEQKIEGHDSSKIRSKRDRLKNLNQQLGTIQNTIDKENKELDEIENSIDRTKKLIKSSNTGVAISGLKLNSVYETLKKTFSDAVSILRQQYKNEVEIAATETFLKLTSDKSFTKLEINNSYGLNIVDANNDLVKERSAGAEHIVSLSLISGLNKVTKINAPIIMDTPFGRLDSKHSNAVMDFLGDVSEQVFVLAHDKEINPNELPPKLSNILLSHLMIMHEASDQSKIIEKNS